MRVRLREIKVVELNSKTVILLTQFVRLARVREGADLKMQHPEIVSKVFRYAAHTDNPDLIVLFMRIRRHLMKYVTKANLEKASFNVYPDVA